MYDKFKVTLLVYVAVAVHANAFYHGCCPTTPPTRHYISPTRTANINEMNEWIAATRDAWITGCMSAWKCMI